MLSINRCRKAGITVEISLSIILALGVLFLSLGLFSNNLASMASNSGITNMFGRTEHNTKTANLAWGHDPTNTQINVAIMGDQGLDAYNQQANATIKTLSTKTTALTRQQIEDLAEALTVFAESGPQSSSDMLKNNTITVNGSTISYQQFGLDNGIKIYLSNKNEKYKTKTPYGTIYWGVSNPKAGANNSNTEPYRIANIVTIKSIFNNG